MRFSALFLCATGLLDVATSYGVSSVPARTSSSTANGAETTSRRELFQRVALTPLASLVAAAATAVAQPAYAVTPTGPNDGNLVDLPPEAVRSYLQYRIPLQTSADFYLFELHDLLADTNQWGEIGELFQVNNNRGQGSPSRMEREFTNTFRILGLSMPPEAADEMREAQFRFEAAAAKISKATFGIRRDLPVEIDKDAQLKALAGWEEGRRAINDFFVVLNDTTGLPEMKPMPVYEKMGEYGRSKSRYLQLKKKVKLCQNRVGPTLSVAWGSLMVTGYLQDSCGIPDLNDYFYQS